MNAKSNVFEKDSIFEFQTKIMSLTVIENGTLVKLFKCEKTRLGKQFFFADRPIYNFHFRKYKSIAFFPANLAFVNECCSMLAFLQMKLN